MTVQVINGPTIRAGESLSDPLDCTAGQLARIVMPPEWTEKKSPVLTFQISPDGVTWNDLFGADGFEVQVKSVVPGSVALVQDNRVRNAWVRFRSGSRVDPAPQEADRVFSVVVELVGAVVWVWSYLPNYGWAWVATAPQA